MENKPFSPSCERNREPILNVLKEQLSLEEMVLEVGSGTGQHAVFFTQHLPSINWQCSDREENLPGIQAWLKEAKQQLQSPLLLDVNSWENIGESSYTSLFSANTLHIMSFDEVKLFFKLADRALQEQGKLLIYGPFKYNGDFTSDSNAKFDLWLKERNFHSGIRNFEDINQLAKEFGFEILKDYKMPANNQLLVFKRSPMKNY